MVAASSQAGWSQQTVDPIRDPTVEDEVSLNDATLPIADKDLPLFNSDTSVQTDEQLRLVAALSDLQCCLCCHRQRRAGSPAGSEWSPDGPDLQRTSGFGQTKPEFNVLLISVYVGLKHVSAPSGSAGCGTSGTPPAELGCVGETGNPSAPEAEMPWRHLKAGTQSQAETGHHSPASSHLCPEARAAAQS